MSDTPRSRTGKKIVDDHATDLIIKDNSADAQASLPPGTLKGPFLDRQGDEQRQPSQRELRELAEIQTKQRRGDKV
jgi:hypothetical protein